MKTLLRSCLALSLICSLLFVSGVLGLNSSVEAATPLSEIIARNWAAWSHGQESVNYHDLIDELANPSYKEADAAALAALARTMRASHFTGQLARTQAVEMAANNHTLQTQYAQFIDSLPQLNSSLFASGKPNFSALKQGPIGDCFFFSGIGWLAEYRPQVIQQAIIEEPNGQYLVKFPNGAQTRVAEPTDAEILFFNSAATITDGLWVTVLEKAVGAILPNYTKRVDNQVETAYNIALGGGPARIEAIWTGASPTVIYLNRKPARHEVREALIRMQERRLMSQALTPAHSIAHSIAGDHVYAILGFNKATDTLTIWNPWGDEYTAKGAPGIQNGYSRKHGVFTMPLDEFMSVYWILSVE